MNISEIINEYKRKADALDNAIIKIGISGQSGSGKSSIINAILGKKVADVGSVETTLEIKEYIHNGLNFYDLPGCGTVNFPVKSYIEKCDLLSYDVFIIVTSNRFYENDNFLIKEMVKAGRPVYVVRTKMDEAFINERRDNNLNEKEVYEKVRNNIFENIQNIAVKGVYLISSVEGVVNDFKRLLVDIENSLDETKKDRFISDIACYNKGILNKKKKLAIERITYSAWASAANGLNPLPGLDVSVDLGILTNLSSQIKDIFGLSENNVMVLNKSNSLLGAIKQFSARFIAKEGILLILKKSSISLVSKIGLKYIPFIGQAIGVGIGYKMTRSFGDDLLEEAYNLANDILESSAEQASQIFEAKSY